MHVGLILEHSDPRRGGAEAYAVQLVDRFRKNGHRVSLASRTGPAARRVPRWLPRSRRPRYYTRVFRQQLRDEGAEVLMTLNPVAGCDFYQPHLGVLRSSLHARRELLPLWRRLDPLRALHVRWFLEAERAAVQPPTRVLALSPRIARELRADYPDIEEPEVLRSGVDLERFRPADAAEVRRLRSELGVSEDPLLLFVAHEFALKGLATVIRALARVPGPRLAVAGDGRQRAFRELARRSGVGERVSWRGFEARMPELYRCADLLVHPTHLDTASLVVLEALASGVPAISTQRDGNADLAERGGGACLPRPGDVDRLVQAIEETLAVTREERAARARKVAERYPAEPLLDRVVERVTCGSSS